MLDFLTSLFESPAGILVQFPQCRYLHITENGQLTISPLGKPLRAIWSVA